MHIHLGEQEEGKKGNVCERNGLKNLGRRPMYVCVYVCVCVCLCEGIEGMGEGLRGGCVSGSLPKPTKP